MSQYAPSLQTGQGEIPDSNSRNFVSDERLFPDVDRLEIV